MRLYQLLLALGLGAGVSYFAGSAVPQAAGPIGHLFTFCASTALFSGLFVGYNKYGASKGCGCPGALPPSGKRPLLPPDLTNIGKGKPGDNPVKPDQCASGDCGHDHKPAKAPARAKRDDTKTVIGVRQFGSKFRNEGSDGAYVEVDTAPQEDGSLLITVTVNGYTSRYFKDRLRPRLEKIPGIKWQFPVNLGENRRQMLGTVAAGANATAALAALEAVK